MNAGSVRHVRDLPCRGDGSALTLTERALLLVIASYTDVTGLAVLGYGAIAKPMGMSRRHIMRLVDGLIRTETLDCRSRGEKGHDNVYWIPPKEPDGDERYVIRNH